MKIKAFTLAEVLITLGIIGVVAAMTIPNLITAYKKHETVSKLEKAISTISNTIKLSEADNGEMETWDQSLSHEEFINTYFRPYIKIVALCSPESNCGYEISNKIWKYLNGNAGGYNRPTNNGRVPFLAIDGIVYTFGYINDEGTLIGDNDKIIIIDINGSQKPNQFGKDVFFLYRKDEREIVPYGADKTTSQINSDCSKNGVGLYCAAKIRNAGWKIPSDYPWK